MPIYHEQWKQAGKNIWLRNRLHPKRQHVLAWLAKKSLIENRDSKVRILRLQSIKYLIKKIYDKLACVPYERMLVQCANNYGVVGLLKNQECNELFQHFRTCINTNDVLGRLKANQPEFFADNEYSRDKPQFSELRIWYLYHQ